MISVAGVGSQMSGLPPSNDRRREVSYVNGSK
jgi:hypothetical protein